MFCFIFNDTATTELYTTDTLFPYTTLFLSPDCGGSVGPLRAQPVPGGAAADRTGAEHEPRRQRSEEHTSELQSLMSISYAVFCLKKTKVPSYTTDTIIS